MTSLIQHFEAEFLWKVSLKILNSGIILKTFTHADDEFEPATSRATDKDLGQLVFTTRFFSQIVFPGS